MMTSPFSLDNGERLLWSGAPRQGIAVRGADLFMVPFSLLWGGFAVFWNVGVWSSNAPPMFRLFGLPFLAAGVYIMVGRFLADAWRRSRTQYAVTSERVMISTGMLSPTLKSLNIRTLTDITLSEKRDGSGSIAFGPSNLTGTMYAGTPWPGVSMPPSFELIPDARRVYDIVRRAQAASVSVDVPAA